MYFKASQLDWAIIGTQRAQLIRQANKTLKIYCKQRYYIKQRTLISHQKINLIALNIKI